MDQFVADQIRYGLKYVPSNIAKSFFIPDSNAETEAMRKKGFICGVCHPDSNYELIKEANIGWVRFDIPYPFDDNGEISESYTAFRNRCTGFRDNGIKVMAITPTPNTYIVHSADIRTDDGTQRIRETAKFLINDLQGIVSGIQVTNEMGMPVFTLPIGMKDAIKFIAVQLEEMYPLRGDIILGYNSAGPQADLHSGLLPYVKYCDYVGIDMYLGCFYGFPGFMWLFDAMLRYLWALTKKPILIQEFGYISGGKPKTKAEKIAILNKYGAKNEADAKAHIVEFTEKLPQNLKEYTKRMCQNDSSRYYDFLFHSDITNHLYTELPAMTKIPGYEHTPEGQAKFYLDIFDRFCNMKFVCGAMIYCYSDSDRCAVCGQSDCPTESRWGLVTSDGKPKLSYYAVKEAISDMGKK